jgi:hypothetical protein
MPLAGNMLQRLPQVWINALVLLKNYHKNCNDIISNSMSFFKIEPHPARLFLPFAIVFGLVMTFLTPPFQSPDEPAHFFRAYQVSDFKILPLNSRSDVCWISI